MSYVESDIIYDQQAERSLEAVTHRLFLVAVCGHGEHIHEYDIVIFQCYGQCECRHEPPPAVFLIAPDYHLAIINRAAAVTCT